MKVPFSRWRLLQSWLLIALGVLLAAHTSEGIEYEGWGVVVLVTIVVSLLNLILRPILVLFTLPFILFTFGLGLVVINAVIFYLAGALVPGFTVASFWSALWAAIVVAVISLLVNLFLGGRRGQVAVVRSTRIDRSKDDVIDV